MKIKSAPLKVKAAGEADGLEEGQFIAYASVFGGPPDSYGDIVDPGAFSASLKSWEEKGDPIPLLWGHDFVDPFSNIGHVVKAEEDDHGLKVTGEFDMENPTAQQVYRLVKGRRTTDLSFAYDITDAEPKDDGYHLKALDIYEVSIVPIGANRLTDVVAVKHLAENIVGGIKDGRVLAAKHIDSLRTAQEAIGAVIAAAEGEKSTAPGGNDDQEKASDAGRAKDEDAGTAGDGHPAVKSEGAARSSSVSTLAAKFNTYAAAYASGERGSR